MFEASPVLLLIIHSNSNRPNELIAATTGLLVNDDRYRPAAENAGITFHRVDLDEPVDVPADPLLVGETMLLALIALIAVVAVMGILRGEGARKEYRVVIRKSRSSAEIVSRLGGDEFVVLLPNLRDTEVAARVAKRMLEALAGGFFGQRWEAPAKP